MHSISNSSNERLDQPTQSEPNSVQASGHRLSSWSESIPETTFGLSAWNLLEKKCAFLLRRFRSYRGVSPIMSPQQPRSGNDNQTGAGLFSRPFDHYRPFHHPFTTSQPVHVPAHEQQSHQFPIFLDRRPPNRLEALVLGGAAQKLKRYRGDIPEASKKEEIVTVDEKPNEEDKRQERRSAVSLKLLSPRLHAEAKPDFELPPPPIRSGIVLRLRYLLTKFVIEWWLLELISWVFSAVCMTTIIAVLWYFDGRQLPQLKLGITLNGFISVFSNLARASLILPTAEALGQLKWNWFRKESKTMMDFEILDSASRGPWGAFLLLLRTRGR